MLMAGDRSGGNTVRQRSLYAEGEPRGYLKAIDPMTGQAKWQTGFPSPNWAGTLVTAGGGGVPPGPPGRVARGRGAPAERGRRVQKASGALWPPARSAARRHGQ